MEVPQYELTIREMNENGEIYFLGKIEGLPWFLVEGDSVEQVKEYAPSVLQAFLESEEELRKEMELKKRMRFTLQAA